MKGFGNNEIKKSFSANEVVREKFKKEAFEAYQRGNINYAIQCFENCIKNGFHDPKFFSQYGIILYKSGFITKAINILEQSILIYPNETELFINLGNIFKLIGDFKKAEKYIKKSYELSPKSSTVLTNLSSIYIEQKKLYDARKFALLSHKADLNKPEPLYNLGIIYSKLYFYKEACFYFKETLKRDKKSYPANLNLGAVLLKLDRLDEAQKYLNVALSLNPNSYEALFNLGQIALYKNKFKESESYFIKSLNQCKNNYEIYQYLGIAQFLNSNFNALENIDKAISLNPKVNISHVLKNLIKVDYASKDSEKYINNNPYDNFGNDPIILHRNIEEELINTLYKKNTSDLNHIESNPHSGNAIGSDYFLFEEKNIVLDTLQNDLKEITSKCFNSEIFIKDAFFRILQGEGKVDKHIHIGLIDMIKGLNLYKKKFSLVYYLKTGDQNCSDPGNLRFYNPDKQILPKPGMIIIFPSDRPHSVVYNGKSDRMILSINFYCY